MRHRTKKPPGRLPQRTPPRDPALRRPLGLERLEDRSMFAVFHGGEMLGPLLPDPESPSSHVGSALLSLEQYLVSQQWIPQTTVLSNNGVLAESGLMFDLHVTGATQVYQGHALYLVLSGTRLSGQTDNVPIGVTGASAGVVISFPDIEATCCGGPGSTFLWQVGSDFSTSLKISVPQSLAVGNYSFAVTLTSNGAVQSHTITFSVLAEPSAVTPQPYAVLDPVPLLEQYNQQMVSYGHSILGNEALIASLGTWEGNAWYYDGTRVAYQIADYTGDEIFREYALNPLDVYRPYVIGSNGQVQGYRVFPQGLRMHFERTGDTLSKQAAISLLNAAYGGNSVVRGELVPEAMSREVAYAIEAMLEAERLGQPRHPRLAEYVDIALGHINQWFVTEQFPYMTPFMFALTAEALVKYHEATGDLRILPALKLGADWIWANTWVSTDKSFVYEYSHGSPLGAGAPDLNLLIAPVYGWIYAQSGDAAYIEKGDQVFAGGVQGAWLAQGKQFTQNYRWSMDYLSWRNQQPGDLCPLPLPLNF